MAGTHDMKAEKLFSVKDYVCVITGGGCERINPNSHSVDPDNQADLASA